MTPQQLRTARSVVLFVGGFAGAAYEVVIDHAERPAILILLAGMMGLPAFLPSRKSDDGNGAGKKTPEAAP
jgi:hypothetical protein